MIPSLQGQMLPIEQLETSYGRVKCLAPRQIEQMKGLDKYFREEWGGSLSYLKSLYRLKKAVACIYFRHDYVLP